MKIFFIFYQTLKSLTIQLCGMEEKVRSDISRRLGQIKTIGQGSSEEGTAYLILQMFDVAPVVNFLQKINA
jgi:hypothetical protein